MLTRVIPAEGDQAPENQDYVEHPLHSLIQYLLSICRVPGRVHHAGDTMTSKLEVVHVVMESRAQQERAKPPSYQTSSGFKVPTNKTGPSRPTMRLFSRTSPCLAHAPPP